jgi:hypothetical protein
VSFFSCFILMSDFECDILVWGVSGNHMNDDLKNNMD